MRSFKNRPQYLSYPLWAYLVISFPSVSIRFNPSLSHSFNLGNSLSSLWCLADSNSFLLPSLFYPSPYSISLSASRITFLKYACGNNHSNSHWCLCIIYTVWAEIVAKIILLSFLSQSNSISLLREWSDSIVQFLWMRAKCS